MGEMVVHFFGPFFDYDSYRLLTRYGYRISRYADGIVFVGDTHGRSIRDLPWTYFPFLLGDYDGRYPLEKYCKIWGNHDISPVSWILGKRKYKIGNIWRYMLMPWFDKKELSKFSSYPLWTIQYGNWMVVPIPSVDSRKEERFDHTVLFGNDDNLLAWLDVAFAYSSEIGKQPIIAKHEPSFAPRDPKSIDLYEILYHKWNGETPVGIKITQYGMQIAYGNDNGTIVWLNPIRTKITYRDMKGRTMEGEEWLIRTDIVDELRRAAEQNGWYLTFGYGRKCSSKGPLFDGNGRKARTIKGDIKPKHKGYFAAVSGNPTTRANHLTIGIQSITGIYSIIEEAARKHGFDEVPIIHGHVHDTAVRPIKSGIVTNYNSSVDPNSDRSSVLLLTENDISEYEVKLV